MITHVAACLVDIAIVVDCSGSIKQADTPGVDNWQYVINFVINVISNVNVGQDESHVAVVTFGTQLQRRCCVRAISIMYIVATTARRYASAVYAAVVCPSVRLSVTRRYCSKTAKRRITQTTPYDSPWDLVFVVKDLFEIPKGSHPTAPNRGGVGWNRRFSSNISLYFNKKLSYRRETARRSMLVSLCYVSRGVAVRKVSLSKSYLKSYSRTMVQFDRLHTISY